MGTINRANIQPGQYHPPKAIRPDDKTAVYTLTPGKSWQRGERMFP